MDKYRYIYTSISLGISFSFSIVTVSELFYCEFFETLLIFLGILLPIK